MGIYEDVRCRSGLLPRGRLRLCVSGWYAAAVILVFALFVGAAGVALLRNRDESRSI